MFGLAWLNAIASVSDAAYLPDSWVDEDGIKIGYEISFTKYFFKPAELRSVEDIITDIEQIENDTDGLLARIVREVRE